MNTKNYNLKEMVRRDKKVRFSFYREGELWYTTEDGFEFPVPTDPNEIGTAVFLAEDKAILFMRYIRKHIAMLEKEQAIQEHKNRVERLNEQLREEWIAEGRDPALFDLLTKPGKVDEEDMAWAQSVAERIENANETDDHSA